VLPQLFLENLAILPVRGVLSAVLFFLLEILILGVEVIFV
jgi:hypothetical protein